MDRGKLKKEEKQSIAEKLPNIDKIQHIVGCFLPDFISLQFHHNSTFPIGAICLKDATRMLSESRLALFEAYVNKLWYSKKNDRNSKYLKVFFVKYYADDITLRLYAAAEHLANAILYMLEIEPSIVPKSKSRSSQASRVGKYLIKEYNTNPITKSIIELIESEEWRVITAYRNKWVHDQPPLIEGNGIVWKRKILWESDGKEVRPGVITRRISFGGGDKPDLTISMLLEYTHKALDKFAKTTEVIVEYYKSKILENEKKTQNKGMRFQVGASINKLLK